MKYFTFISLIFCLVFCTNCTNKNKAKKEAENQISESVVTFAEDPHKTLQKSQYKRQVPREPEINDQIFDLCEGTPPITNLPFVTHFNEVADFVNLERYALPPVLKTNFIFTDPDRGNLCYPRENIIVDSIFRFTFYNYQLPDISIYNVYLVLKSGTDVYRFKQIDDYCSNFSHRGNNGYILLYNHQTSTLNIIDAFYYEPGGDESLYRTFHIDENYKIHLQNYSLGIQFQVYDESGELFINGGNPWMEIGHKLPTFRCSVEILSEGELKVEYPQRFDYRKRNEKGYPAFIKPTTIIFSHEGEVISEVIHPIIKGK